MQAPPMPVDEAERIAALVSCNVLDFWSLGVVMYELLTGRPPFEGAQMVEICSKVLAVVPPSLAEARPSTPSRLIRVVECCLEKDPARRFANMHDLTLALGKVCSS